jgi:hypothetical protein
VSLTVVTDVWTTRPEEDAFIELTQQVIKRPPCVKADVTLVQWRLITKHHNVLSNIQPMEPFPLRSEQRMGAGRSREMRGAEEGTRFN